jgi:hypothetical protein
MAFEADKRYRVNLGFRKIFSELMDLNILLKFFPPSEGAELLTSEMEEEAFRAANKIRELRQKREM